MLGSGTLGWPEHLSLVTDGFNILLLPEQDGSLRRMYEGEPMVEIAQGYHN